RRQAIPVLAKAKIGVDHEPVAFRDDQARSYATLAGQGLQNGTEFGHAPPPPFLLPPPPSHPAAPSAPPSRTRRRRPRGVVREAATTRRLSSAAGDIAMTTSCVSNAIERHSPKSRCRVARRTSSEMPLSCAPISSPRSFPASSTYSPPST